MSAIFLSYLLNEINPIFGSVSQTMKIEAVKSIKLGDSCNVFSIGFENHWGTHVDCPAHFFKEGAGICDYDAEYWFFSNPQVIFIEVEDGQILTEHDLGKYVLPGSDLLIIKSGWGRYRGYPQYSLNNPGLSPELGLWLRRERPKIRAIGFDWISLSSYQNRVIGRKAHKAFLDPCGEGHPILIIEDMFLPGDIQILKEVQVVPLRIEGIDSAPCTVIAKI